MYILLAGVPDLGWNVPPRVEVVSSPLDEAGTLTDYDLIVLKPELWGGILHPSWKRYTENGIRVWDHEWQAGELIHEKVEDVASQLIRLAPGRLLVLPAEDSALYYRIPRGLSPTEASLYRALGKPDENFRPMQAVRNLSVLAHWGVQTENARHGVSLQLIAPGHPLAAYLRLRPVKWDVTYMANSPGQRVIATDGTGSYKIAMDVTADGAELLVIPEIAHPAGLTTLISGTQDLAARASRTRIRLPVEARALETLAESVDALQAASARVADAYAKLLEAQRTTDATLTGEPVIVQALAEYQQALHLGPPEGMTYLHRAWERLRKHHGQGEKAFMSAVGVSRTQRLAVTKVANQGSRHVNNKDPAAPPTVTAADFDAAVAVMTHVLATYADSLT